MFFPLPASVLWLHLGKKREESFWEVIQFYHDRRAISRKAIMQVRKGEIEKKGNNKLERRRRLRLHEAQEKAGRKLFFNVGAKTFFLPLFLPPPSSVFFPFFAQTRGSHLSSDNGTPSFLLLWGPAAAVVFCFPPVATRGGKLCEVLQTHIKLTYPGSQEAVKILLLLGKRPFAGGMGMRRKKLIYRPASKWGGEEMGNIPSSSLPPSSLFRTHIRTDDASSLIFPYLYLLVKALMNLGAAGYSGIKSIPWLLARIFHYIDC